MKKQRVYLGKGWPYYMQLADKNRAITPIKNISKFWCRCESRCKCKPFKFYAERVK